MVNRSRLKYKAFTRNPMGLTEKRDHLFHIIQELPGSAVAFSGGVDSTLLASVVHEVQGTEAVALTVDSAFVSRSEMDGAFWAAAEIGITHQVITLKEIDEQILANPTDRCYHCKKVIFGRLLETAHKMGKQVLLEGTNLDDLDDYRPGLKAVKELEVRSPLLEAQLTKEEIRQLSRSRGLSTWKHVSMACLASRIPYNDLITPESLQMVEQAESFLKTMGLKGLRVRKHGSIARIEVSADERSLFFDLTLMETVSRELKKIGFQFVTLDLEGYRTGSLN